MSSSEYSFVVETDLFAPVIASYSPAAVVNTRDPVVSITFTDDVAGVVADGVSIEVTDADGAAVGGSVELVGAGDAPTMSGTATFSAGAELANGSYNVSATITDGDGKVTPVAWSFTVLVDDDPPVIVTVSPLGIVRTSDVRLSANFFDDSTVESATFSIDGGGAEDGEIVDNSRASYDASGLSQGAHSVVVTVTDSYGNAASTEYSFVVEVDIIAPTIASIAPSGFVASRQPMISATYTDNLSGVDAGTVELTVNGSAVDADATDTGVTYQPDSDLDTGTHTVSLTVSDALGNEASATWEFTIETTPPSITGVSPVDGARVGKNVAARTDVVVSAYYSDSQSGVDVDSVEIQVNADGVEVAGEVQSQTESGIAWKASSVLRAGMYRATVTLADNLGNSTTHTWLFMVEEEEAITIPVRVVPNPFESNVSVWVGLGKEAEVRVRIYDLNGRLIASRPGQILLPGRHAIDLTSEIVNYSRGVYICQVIVDAADRERVVKLVKMAKIK